MVRELRAMGLLAVVDKHALVAYCQTWARWKAAEEFLAKHGETYPIREEGGKVRCMQQWPQVAIARNLLLILKGYQQEFGKSPRMSMTHTTIWDAMQVLYAGLEAQRGQKFDADRFIAAVRGKAFESPRGPISIDKANGDIVQNAYIRKVEKRDGQLQNIEFDVIKDVSPR